MVDCNVVVNVSGPLNHAWLSGDTLGVFTKSDNTFKAKSGDLMIEEVRWSTSMHNDEFMRRLVKHSFEIFSALQENTLQKSCINYSIHYRAALATCSNEIFSFIKNLDSIDEARAMHLTAEGKLIQTLELIWHLAELVFMQVLPCGYLAFSLCSWFYVQSQEAANCAREFLESVSKEQTDSVLIRDKLNKPKSLENNQHFWSTILSLVLQARCQEAASILVLHSNSNGRGLRSLRQLLSAMPVASDSEKEGIWTEYGAQFSQAWNYWQSECQHRMSSGEFEHVGGDAISIEYVKLIVNIISGRTSVWDDPRILEVTKGSRGWFFRFVSFIFYTDQMVNAEGLSKNLDRWLALTSKENSEPGSNFDQSVDAIITSIFRVDLLSFTHLSSEKLGNCWFIAHFTNLLNHIYPGIFNECLGGHKKGSVKPTSELNSSSYQGEEKVSIVESFLLSYVESLSSETCLLSIALGYLDYCKFGRPLQSTLLLRHARPVSTRATNWFISQAEIRGLHSTVEDIAKLNCRKYLNLSLQSNENTNHLIPVCAPTCMAVGWALFAHDYPTINRLAEISLARDCGFMNKDISDGDQKAAYSMCSEVSELAAIILGYFRTLPFNNESSSNNTPATQVSRLPLSPELAFLIRYSELQQCFNDGHVESAVDRLIDLLVTTSSGVSSTCNTDKQDWKNSSSLSIDLRIPTRLKIRLLSEVRHLLGRNRLRRDQVEVLISALVELRADLDINCNNTSINPEMHSLLTGIHMSLAKELASTFFNTCESITLTTPSVSPANSAVSLDWP
uniref:Nuclear pore complex protein Nup85 n=1 Tax=Trichobilharzia regenti TaxID=157069 RepID=A0AA85KLA2_TRIRE|nr:unnamed protein product [Trichobilharzia regenti]